MNRSQIRDLFQQCIDADYMNTDSADLRFVVYNKIIDDVATRVLELIDCRCNFTLTETVKDELERMKVSIYK